MKTAEEWAKEIDNITGGGIFSNYNSEEDFIEIIKRIQLDAYNQALKDYKIGKPMHRL